GLVRRRVAETLGQALLTLAMMAGGFWVIVDPTGTVGALGAWANQASLGTLAATARGTPAGAGRVLAEGMGTVFSAAIEVPWCYLEFGDVGWCRDGDRLDPALHSAALTIANEEAAGAVCVSDEQSSVPCALHDGGDPASLRNSATLLRAARTNGAIFLALPANGSARNSINDRRSLLWAICHSEVATGCRGPSAAAAEFRTNHGTLPRVGGLLLILAGVLGMLLLLGFVALRLLTAALFSLLYLLLAPIAVLAPALGENGRAAFRKWGTHLLGAVASKLIFSFLLGVVLVVLGILADLQALGWWTQWLLMSAFWWSAFVRRNQLLQLAGATRTSHERRALLQRVGDVVEPRRRLREHWREARERRRVERLGGVAKSGGGLTDAAASARDARHGSRGPASTARLAPPGDAQAQRLLAGERRAALARIDESGEAEARMAAVGTRLERVRAQGAIAAAAGDMRRAASLSIRGGRLEAALEGERNELVATRPRADEGSAVTPGWSESPAAEGARTRFLDEQAVLPAAIEAHRTGARPRRDYVALAALAGYEPREFQQLGAAEQRAARVAIDRELALRKRRLAGGDDGRRSGSRAADDRSGHGAAPTTPGAAERAHQAAARRARPSHATRSGTPESRLMRDVREVEAGRKRQLGYDEP
ncbi:MAG TPA: hypothetical protein VK761_04740, partial [Solirubrobacteraceae bacterium]|nr:hypothetical protein [Solirubrobacteraceae bacterium]